MPAPLTMRKLLAADSGVPRRGLVGAWHFFYENLALQSDSFNTTWSATNITVDANTVADPVTGLLTADTLTASADNATILQTIVMPASTTVRSGLWLKRKTGTGDIKIQTKAGTTTTVAVTGEWAFWPADNLAIGGAAESNAFGVIIATNGDAVYAARAQVYPGPLPEYAATTDLQSLAGAYGTAYALQRGSTANADSNDFTPLGPGASFTTDDYGVSASAVPVTLAGPWMAIVVAKFTSVTDGSRLFGVSADADNYVQIRKNGSILGNLTFLVRDGTSTQSDLLAVGSGVVCVALSMLSGIATMKLLSSGVSVTGGTARNPVGSPSVYVGAGYSSALAPLHTHHSALLYNRIPPNTEQQRAYRGLKAYWLASPRNVTVE